MNSNECRTVAVGVDAAITANHHVVVRVPQAGGRGEVIDDFTVAPTMDGMRRLTERLSGYDAAVATAEPTSMTWLSLSIALGQAGVPLTLVGARHLARLRGAVSGKNKSDVIDAELLAAAPEVFDLHDTPMPTAAELALKRACRRRHTLLIDANRTWRRLVSLGRWALPDVWNALRGSRAAILGVLSRWPHLEALSRARLSSIADEIAAHSRAVTDVADRAAQVRTAARVWVQFWDGHLELDALAWELTEILDEYTDRYARVDRATAEATRWWEILWGDDDLLLSVPGMGPVIAPIVRAHLGDASRFPEAKHAASYVGLNPSNWSSGTVVQPSRAITKEGPDQLRLAFYQAANTARTLDVELATFYRMLMLERGHCHTQANVAVARKLVGRTWRVLTRGTPYQFHDLDGHTITRRRARAIAKTITVPEDIRRRARARSAATHRSKLTR